MSLVWLNGELLPPEQARIDPGDRGLLLGDGIFETIRAEDGEPVHLARHLARLRNGAAFLGIAVPDSDIALFDGLRAVAATIEGPAALRLTLTRGPAPRGLLPPLETSPTCLITAASLPNATPVRSACIASVTRRNEFSPLSRLKTVNYLDGVLARREAAMLGADEALLLNTQGRLAEATAANVFVRICSDLFTPPVSEGALPGIARALLLESREAVERPLTLEMLRAAEEVFLANALGQRRVERVME